MEKDRWPEFLSSKIKSQIAFESSQKIQHWALGILGFIALGFALEGAAPLEDRLILFATKVLFLAFFHIILIFGFYIPSLLQKGQRPFARLLEIRDFTSLIFVALVLSFYSIVTVMLSHQLTTTLADTNASDFFGFTAALNFLVTVFYLAASLIFCAGIFFLSAISLKSH